MHATLVSGAPGQGLDADDLTIEQARAWGVALAGVHRDGTEAAAGLELADGWARTQRDFVLLAGDQRVIRAVDTVWSRLAMLARTPGIYCLNHGDFEGDNFGWTCDQVIAYDWDVAERSWFAADIAYAVRDLVTEPRDRLGKPIPLLPVLAEGPEKGARLIARPAAGDPDPRLPGTVVERYAQRQRTIAADLATLLE